MKGARISAPRFNQNHAEKTMQSREPPALRRGGWGEEIFPRRAPDGAAAEFEELRQLWQRPYGMNVAKALAAFNRVAGDGDTPAAVILESARRWVAAREPAFLPALERWLDDGAWRNDPPARRNNSQRKASAVEVAVRLARPKGVDGEAPPKAANGNGEAHHRGGKAGPAAMANAAEGQGPRKEIRQGLPPPSGDDESG